MLAGNVPMEEGEQEKPNKKEGQRGRTSAVEKGREAEVGGYEGSKVRRSFVL